MAVLSEPIKISDSEWEVLRVIWTQKEATAQQIIDILSASKDWKPATVKTLLGRLAKKEAVRTRQEGKKFIYYPKATEADTVRSATENLFSHICARHIGRTIGELIQQAELTSEDIQFIQDRLDEKEAAENIECNCIPGQCECSSHQHKC